MAGCLNLRQGPAWFDIKAMVMLRRLLTCLNAHGSSHGDHGAVVGAQMEFGVMHPNSCFLTSLVQLQSQGPVGAHTASHHQTSHARGFQCRHGFLHQHLHNGCFSGCSQICFVSRVGVVQTGTQFWACVNTDVLSPANEKSKSPLCNKGRGNLNACGLPPSAHLDNAGPPG